MPTCPHNDLIIKVRPPEPKYKCPVHGPLDSPDGGFLHPVFRVGDSGMRCLKCLEEWIIEHIPEVMEIKEGNDEPAQD